VCGGEKAKQVCNPSVDCEPVQEEAAFSRLRYVTDVCHTGVRRDVCACVCVCVCVCFNVWKLGCRKESHLTEGGNTIDTCFVISSYDSLFEITFLERDFTFVHVNS